MDDQTTPYEESTLVENSVVAFDSETSPTAKKRSRVARRIALTVLILLVAWLVWYVLQIFLSPDRRIQQVYLVPNDAALIIQSDEPVADWRALSGSQPWLTLKNAPAFSLVTERADYLDSLLLANKSLLSLVGRREMTVSIHKTRSDDWDFLMILDMQRASKVEILKDQIEHIYKMGGQQVTVRSYNGVIVNELRDPVSRDILYTAFVGNHFVCSYNARLLEASIDEREHPHIGRQYAFIEAEKLVAGKGLYRLFVNYDYLPQFMSIYLDGNDYIESLSRSMSFAGLYLKVDPKGIGVKGYSLLREKPEPYLQALLSSGSQKIRAHEIMSARTALYVNYGISDVGGFVMRLEQALSESSEQAYTSYREARQKIEKYFDISLEQDFLGWMSGEFAFSQSEPGLLGRQPERILAIKATDINRAKESMSLIEKRVRRRTPIAVRSVIYKDYQINYVHLKGFFRLFFGRLFDGFDTPYYTYIGDYVVMSDRSASLLSFIEDYEQGNLLTTNSGFNKALAEANTNSTIFAWTDIPRFYEQLPELLNAETMAHVRNHRYVLFYFPGWCVQLVDQGGKTSVGIALKYEPYSEPAPQPEPTPQEDPAMNEEATTEKELISELRRFYVEKFEGNVLREFYESGALLSEAEVRRGKRQGRYRVYYETGELLLRGRYAGDQPRGTWKYYTRDGKFDYKVKH